MRRRAWLSLWVAVLGLHWLLLHTTGPMLQIATPRTQPAHLQLRTVQAPVAAPGHRLEAQHPSPAAPPAAAAPQPPAPPGRRAANLGATAATAATADPVVPSTETPAPVAPVALAPPAPGAPALAVALPDSASIAYRATARVRGLELEGQALLQWRHDGSHYQATLQIDLPGRPVRQQRSTGAITAGGLAPLRYSDRHRSEEATHFDHGGHRIVFSSNRPAVAMEPGAQDRLSVLMQLQAMASGEPARFAPGSSVRVQTAGTREADWWRFTVDAQEALALPGGTVQALRLTRAPSHEYEPLLEVWLGPAPDYAPVRLRLTQPGGDWQDLQWSGTDRG